MAYAGTSAKELFYYEILQCKDFPSEEVLAIIKKKGQESGFYEVCSKFADIGLNAPKRVEKGTCDVEASFQYSDMNVAIMSATQFVLHNHLQNLDEFYESIRQLHYRAVEWDDKREKGGLVSPENYLRHCGYAGKYYSFAQLPDDVLDYIYDGLCKAIGGEKK